MSEITITKENFEQEVLKADKPVFIDFWATWCGPCRMFSPVVAQLAEKYDGKLIVGKVNTDEEPELSALFGVSSIPMAVIMKDGKAVTGSIGYRPLEQIEEMVKPWL